MDQVDCLSNDYNLGCKRALYRQLDAVLLLDKPVAISSNRALQMVKKIFGVKKAGHSGSLDPLASGMLPICLGQATKFSQFLLNSDKSYLVKAKLGIRTNTADADGDAISIRAVPNLNDDQIEDALSRLRGDILQVPPMYSALKLNGQPLYKLARRGIEVDRAARAISVYKLCVEAKGPDELALYVHCSKGTYVRSLVDELGELLGCGAHVVELRRLSVAHYNQNQMASLDRLCQADDNDKGACLLPISSMLSGYVKVYISLDIARSLYMGKHVSIAGLSLPDKTTVSLYLGEDRFFGVAECNMGSCIVPKRLLQLE